MDANKRFEVVFYNLFFAGSIILVAAVTMVSLCPEFMTAATYNGKLLENSCTNLMNVIRSARAIDHMNFVMFFVTELILLVFFTGVSVALDYKRWTLIDHRRKCEVTSFRERMAHSFLQFSLWSPLDILCFSKKGKRLADFITGFDMTQPHY